MLVSEAVEIVDMSSRWFDGDSIVEDLLMDVLSDFSTSIIENYSMPQDNKEYMPIYISIRPYCMRRSAFDLLILVKRHLFKPISSSKLLYAIRISYSIVK